MSICEKQIRGNFNETLQTKIKDHGSVVKYNQTLISFLSAYTML